MTTRIYGFTALTGGGTGALDKYPEAGMPALATDDYAIGHVAGVFYIYWFNGASAEAESPPAIIAPASGSGRWILKGFSFAHNDLASIDGGNASPEEYYHLSSADYNTINTALAQSILANPTGGAAPITNLTVAEQTLVGRITGGNVDDLSVTQVKTLIGDVSDTAYGTSWNGVTDVAPSKNAVYDQMQLQMLKTGSNLAIGSDADGDMYYRASSVLARLAKGAANLSLFMNAGATAPEWASGIKYGTFTRVTSVGSGDVSYTGVGFKPSAIIIISNFPSDVASTSISIGFGTTDGNIYMQYVAGVGSVGSTNNIVNVGNGSTAVNYANLKSFDSDGFTLTWTKVGSPTSTAKLGYLAFR